MVSPRAYLDYNATAPVRAAVREMVNAVLEETGNPSSVHGEGRRARGRIETARQAVASLVGIAPDGVTFTSGGTEANHLALEQAVLLGATGIVVSAIEHPSLTEAAKRAAAVAGVEVTFVPVTEQGGVDLTAFDRALAGAGGKPFVSIMSANNETGAIQPLAEIAARTHAAGGVMHSDMIQSAGKLGINLSALGIDMASLSAHKIGGPQGVGAFVLAEDGAVKALQTGGGQERGRRSGTENTAGIAGFGAAAAEALHDLGNGTVDEVKRLRGQLEQTLRACAPHLVIFAETAERLPNTSCFSAPGLKAETLLMQLDLAGFAVSAGSACSSGKVARSHVLAAMRVDDNLASGAVRVSLGHETTEDQVNGLATAWAKAYQRLSFETGRADHPVAAEG